MLHVSDAKDTGKVDFILLPTEVFIRSIEINESVEPVVLDLAQMPMYENFKALGLKNKCWSHVKVESKNGCLCFTFLGENDDHNQALPCVLVDDYDNGIALNRSSSSYHIPLENIKTANYKIHFFHKEELSKDAVFQENKVKTEQLKLQSSQYLQPQLWLVWLFNKCIEEFQWYQDHGMLCLQYGVSFIQYSTKTLAQTIFMAPLRSMTLVSKLLLNSMYNAPLYVLFFGSYFATTVLGAGNKTSIIKTKGTTSLTLTEILSHPRTYIQVSCACGVWLVVLFTSYCAWKKYKKSQKTYRIWEGKRPLILRKLLLIAPSLDSDNNQISNEAKEEGGRLIVQKSDKKKVVPIYHVLVGEDADGNPTIDNISDKPFPKSY